MATAKKKTERGGLQLLPHYPALIAFVWEHRFATVEQVYQAFSDSINSYFTAHYQCRRLVAHGYLAVARARSHDRTFPHVLVATKRGLRLVADRYQAVTGCTWSEADTVEHRRVARGRSDVYLTHKVQLTGVDLLMRDMAAKHPLVRLLKTERRYHQPDRQLACAGPWGATISFAPDAGYFFLRQGSEGPWLDLCLLELDRANSVRAIGESLAAYEAWYASAAGEPYLTQCCVGCGDTTSRRPTFRLLRIIGHRPGEGSDAQRLVKVLLQALQTSPTLQRRLWLTTYDAFINQDGQDAPIWMPVKDARLWRGDYERPAEHLAGDPDWTKQLRTAKHRAFVKYKVRQMWRYCLFPPVVASAQVAEARQHLRV